MKKVLSLVLTLAFVLGMLTIVPLTAAATNVPTGTGTSTDPYVVSDAIHMLWLADNGATIGTAGTTADANVGRTVYIELANDIDCNGAAVTLVDDLGWGNVKGSKNEWHIDGKGFAIKNMGNALFYSIQANSEIKNLKIIGAQVAPSISNAGILVGFAPKGVTVKNVSIDATSKIELSGNHVSWIGLCNGPLVLENCFNAATINNTKDDNTTEAGGFVGSVENGVSATVKNCVNVGTVTAKHTAGGIVGQVKGGASVSFQNCVNLGTVTAATANEFVAKTIASKTNCYAKADYATKATEVDAIIAPLHTHTYTNACDADCDYCLMTRTVDSHEYDNGCDFDCNTCGTFRTPEDHVYDNNCDEKCNVCDSERAIEHDYDNACDATCGVCGKTRTVGDHIYDNDKDATCNICGAERTFETTAPETTVPETTAAAAEEKGCGGALNSAYAVIALVAVLGFAFVAKKREEN